MKKLSILLTLMIAFCIASPTAFYGQTDSTGNCYTSAEIRFFDIKVLEAERDAIKGILLTREIVADSGQIFVLTQQLSELNGQLSDKDTIIQAEQDRKNVVVRENNKLSRQKFGWKAGFFATWSAFISLFIYDELKK